MGGLCPKEDSDCYRNSVKQLLFVENVRSSAVVYWQITFSPWDDLVVRDEEGIADGNKYCCCKNPNGYSFAPSHLFYVVMFPESINIKCLLRSEPTKSSLNHSRNYNAKRVQLEF